MKRSTIVWSIVVIVIIALGIWYFSSTSPAAPAGTTATSTAATSTATTTSAATRATGSSASTASAGSATFHSIFAQSGNHECTFEQVSSSSKSTSVIDISNGKMRGEFRTTGATDSATYMIYDGGLLYTWSEGATTGTKTSIKSLSDLPAVIPTDLTSGAIYGVSTDNVGWDCHDWLADQSVFVIPSYVTFTTAK